MGVCGGDWFPSVVEIKILDDDDKVLEVFFFWPRLAACRIDLHAGRTHGERGVSNRTLANV